MQANKPVTEVLLKHKEHQSIQELAETLEKIAQKLRTEGQFIFVQGTEQVVVAPSGQVKVEYEYTKKGEKHSFEIEFDWYEGIHPKQKLSMGIE
ncbi:amphi-Trp domain-containing protein [Lysinibacillus sp. KU-BSD001]|uniref:amphi-Trp domain-containing protein n=1 Tax=Lysinibacillus sp. KU-BSD001 TaxID=3141328 RepID=UPI0036E99FEA